jgi:hypothetical protein
MEVAGVVVLSVSLLLLLLLLQLLLLLLVMVVPMMAVVVNERLQAKSYHWRKGKGAAQTPQTWAVGEHPSHRRNST